MENQINIVVLGGTSAIALAYVRRRMATLATTNVSLAIWLIGRDEVKLKSEVANFNVLGASANYIVHDLNKVDSAVLDTIDERFDEVILAYGALTDQKKAEDNEIYRAMQVQTNFASAAGWIEIVLEKFSAVGDGRLIVIGSVAGDRGRQSNYAYGACKAGLATWVQGAQHRFASTKSISITLVKPGFVDTPMTDHLQKDGLLWATPDQIAGRIERATLKRKRVVYVPFFWRPIMFIIRSVPTVIFEKTEL